MNHLQKNIEVYFYVSTIQCKPWSIAISARSLQSLPEIFPFFSLRDNHSSEFGVIIPFFFFIVSFTITQYLLHRLLFSYFVCLVLNFTHMESCFMLTCFFNINFEMIYVDAFSCSLFISIASSVLLYEYTTAFLSILQLIDIWVIFSILWTILYISHGAHIEKILWGIYTYK